MLHARHRGMLALMFASLAWGCTSAADVTVHIQPPPMDDAGAAVLSEVYSPGAQCVLFAAVGLMGPDTAIHAVAVRTLALLPAGPSAGGAPPCIGADGAAVIGGLSTSTLYLVELVLLQPADWATQLPDPNAMRIVSLQDFDLASSPGTNYICLSDPSLSSVYTPLLDLGSVLCANAPVLPSCTLDIPAGRGGLCPAAAP